MPQTVEELIRGHRPLATVPYTATVREAVNVMVENGYNQVPVLDENGWVKGLFTQQALALAFRLDIASTFLDSPVDQFIERPGQVVGPTRSIFDVALLLQHQRVVVIGQQSKPIGIVTDHDIAVYLGEWAQGIALVEEIETRLRVYIERVLWTQNMLDAALICAFGQDPEHSSRPARKYDELGLGEHIQLVTEKDNWPKFEPYLKPKSVCESLLSAARPIRNQIAHFRGQLTHTQLQTLETARLWLARCPRVPAHDQDTTGMESGTS